MDENKPPDPVTEFIRFRIAKWEEGGGKLKDLAAAAGLAKSMPSQIKARTSAASFYSAEKFAAPFGFADLPALVAAAFEWWRSGRESDEPAAETPVAEALRIIRNYGINESQVQRVLVRYPSAEYEHKDTLWWLAKFHEARSDDADVASEARAEKSEAAATKRRVMRGREEIRIAAKVAREKAKPANVLVARSGKKAG